MLLVFSQAHLLSAAPPPPKEYKDLYQSLNQTLDAFHKRIDSEGNGKKHSVAFTAELLAANSNIGFALLDPNRLRAVRSELDQLSGLGVKSISLAINFPILSRPYYRWLRSDQYPEILNRYKEVAKEVRKRGMKLIIQSQTTFGTAYSDSRLKALKYYKTLSLNEYRAGRSEVINLIAKELKPDYLSVAAEPDTEGTLSGMKINNAKDYSEMVRYLVTQLKPVAPANLSIGAGIGVWQRGAEDYLRNYCDIKDLDYINFHHYPINNSPHLRFTDKLFTLVELAQSLGKDAAIGEAWVLKSRDSELGRGSAAIDPTVFSRDTFSFWAPLDQKFLSAMNKFAHLKKLRYLSHFWSKYFFSYLNYTVVKNSSPKDIIQKSIISAAMARNRKKYSETGLAYAKLLGSPIQTDEAIRFCNGKPNCPGKNPRIKDIKIIQQNGVRPRWSPDGKLIAFDRENSDGYFDVYLCDKEGSMVMSLTEDNPKIGQKNNGNPVFHPSGEIIVFQSEAEQHALSQYPSVGNPGVGLLSNLWATDSEGKKFWQLTDIPIKKKMRSREPVVATVNPHFSKDGSILYWTERYAEGGHLKWGKWRVKVADFNIKRGIPQISNIKVLLSAEDVHADANYVTFMEELSPDQLLVAANLDGQHEYGMDQYIYNPKTGNIANLTNTPKYWEEDSSLTSRGKIIYMTNKDSRFKFDFAKKWTKQPMERDYYLMDPDGSHKERLTYFNDSSASEYIPNRIRAVASDLSPDGKSLAATLGVDLLKNDQEPTVQLKLALIEFFKPQ